MPKMSEIRNGRKLSTQGRMTPCATSQEFASVTISGIAILMAVLTEILMKCCMSPFFILLHLCFAILVHMHVVWRATILCLYRKP